MDGSYWAQPIRERCGPPASERVPRSAHQGTEWLVVFVLRHPSAAMDPTYDALRAAGLPELTP
jgi:hypothetical protein